MTLTIVSGAAPGVEQGAIEAAVNLALRWQGRASREHIAALPAIYRAGLQPTSAVDPGMVRRLNCQDADGALVFSTSMVLVGVPAFVDRVTEQMQRAFLHVTLNPAALQAPLPDEVRDHVRDWIRSNELARVYVTGPSADDVPGIQGAVRDALIAILEPFAVEEVQQVTSVLDAIQRVAAELPNLPERPPMTTDDALRQVALTGDEDSRRLAIAELLRRTSKAACRPFGPPEGLDEVQRDQLDASIREAERDICGPEDMARARDRLADQRPGDENAMSPDQRAAAQRLAEHLAPLSERTHWIRDPDFDVTACGKVGKRTTYLERVDCPECRSFEPLYRPDRAALQARLIRERWDQDGERVRARPDLGIDCMEMRVLGPADEDDEPPAPGDQTT